jgi:hypothetical protein
MRSDDSIAVTLSYNGLGEVSERPKEHDWKSCISRNRDRGFKSHPLRGEDGRRCLE